MKKYIAIILIVLSIVQAKDLVAQEDTTKLMAMKGKPAPEFKLPNLDWKDVQLSEKTDKVILIDFWASWCHYCRQFNGELVELYDIYNKEGFEIISISLDSDYYKWKKAVTDDGLKWININDREGLESKVAEEYNIIHTPTTFLLNKNKMVEAIDLEGDELEEKIKELLE